MQQKRQALRSLCKTVDQMLSSLRWPPERSARVWVSHSTTLKICLDTAEQGSGPSLPWFGLWNLNVKGCRGDYSWFARVAEPCRTYSCTGSRPAVVPAAFPLLLSGLWFVSFTLMTSVEAAVETLKGAGAKTQTRYLPPHFCSTYKLWRVSRWISRPGTRIIPAELILA